MSGDDINRENEALDSIVRTDGVGEDPAVAALLSDDFVTASEVEALDVKLALQQLIRGQSALLNNMDTMSGEVSRLRQRMTAYEAAASAYEQDRKKFVEEIESRSELLLKREEERNAIRAKAVNDVSEMVAVKKANAKMDAMEMKRRLLAEPTETVLVTGNWVNVSVGQGRSQMKLYPEYINIHGVQFKLEPGQHTVPRSVAEIIRQRQANAAEQAERKEAISAAPGKIRKDTEVAKDWDAISKKYNSSAGQIVTASNY